jgi:hypothetical protein
MTKRAILLDINLRDYISNSTKSEMVMLAEESIAYRGPNPARAYIQIIEDASIRMQGHFISKYYDFGERRIKEISALQELTKIKNHCKDLEEKTNSKYSKLKLELESKWGELLFIDNMNNPSDHLSSGIFNLLLGQKEIQSLLSPAIKERISLITGLKIANFGAEICRELSISPKINPSITIEEFYRPDSDPYAHS